MKRIKRLDKINSLTKFLFAVFSVFILFAFTEIILANFSKFSETLNNLEYYAGISFSDEDLKTAIKAREDLALIDERIIGVPGTTVYKYRTARVDSFNFNSFGFRGEEPGKKEENEFRIAVFGDSRIVGIYLAEDKTIPSVVGKRLKANFPDTKITVFNLGIEGYELQRAIAFAELTAEDLQLDMAVFCTAINDVNYSFENGPSDLPPFTSQDEIYQNLVENIAENKKKPFYKRSRLISIIKEAFMSDFVKYSSSFPKDKIFAPLLPEYEKRAVDSADKFIERMTETSKKFSKKGIKTVFFIPPALQMKKKWSLLEQNLIYKNETLLRGYNNYAVKFIEHIKESEEPLVFSQAKVFDETSDTMIFDGIHLTPQASELVADDIAEKVTPIIRELISKKNFSSEKK